MGRALQKRRRGLEDLFAERTRPDRPAGGLLNLLHLAQEILEFMVGRTHDTHAAEIADIALIVTAGIERQDLALFPALVGRRPVVAGTGRDEAVFEGEATSDLLATERFDELPLGRAPARGWRNRQHRINDAVGGLAQELKFLWRLARP